MMKRIVVALMSLVAAVAIGGPATASAAPTNATCHVENAGGTVVAPADCPPGSLIATYRYREGATLDGGFDDSLPQTLFDWGGESARLPECGPWQADIITPGDVFPVIDRQHLYSNSDRLLAASKGDAGECVEATTTTTTEATTTTTLPETTTTVAKASGVQLARTGQGTTNLAVIAGALLMIGAALLAWAVRPT